MEDMARLWNIDPIKVPHWNEPTHIENILSFIAKGTIQMMWISGTNPLVSLPNLGRVRELLTKDDLFVVAQDIFMTETAAIADVVLPGAQWGEKTGCFTNVDRTVHISHKAVEPPGEARSDLEIFLDYGKRMGFKDKDGQPLMPFKTSEEVFEAWKKMSKGRPCDYSGLSYEKLTGGSGIQWPCNDEAPFGTERLFSDKKFFTELDYCESFGHDLETGAYYTKDEYKKLNPNGRAILKACHYFPSSEEPNDEYPLRLSTGRRVHHFHTRTKTGRTQLQKKDPEPEIVISEEDARRLELLDREEVLVESVRGKVQLPVSIGGIEKGNTFIPFHFDAEEGGKARAANELTTGKSLPQTTLFSIHPTHSPQQNGTPYPNNPCSKAAQSASPNCPPQTAKSKSTRASNSPPPSRPQPRNTPNPKARRQRASAASRPGSASWPARSTA
jgi:ferredoxin-nitrate reductase